MFFQFFSRAEFLAAPAAQEGPIPAPPGTLKPGRVCLGRLLVGLHSSPGSGSGQRGLTPASLSWRPSTGCRRFRKSLVHSAWAAHSSASAARSGEVTNAPKASGTPFLPPPSSVTARVGSVAVQCSQTIPGSGAWCDPGGAGRQLVGGLQGNRIQSTFT
jgi:hypothetical protein